MEVWTYATDTDSCSTSGYVVSMAGGPHRLGNTFELVLTLKIDPCLHKNPTPIHSGMEINEIVDGDSIQHRSWIHGSNGSGH